MYGISESGLLLWLGETHAISQRSILQPTRVIIAQHVARRLATFSKKQSVTKSRTILDIFIVLKVFFFFFSLFQILQDIVLVRAHLLSCITVALEHAENLPTTGNQACYNTLKCCVRLARFSTSHNPVKRSFNYVPLNFWVSFAGSF